MFGGSLCYPSGYMTSVAALIRAFVVAVSPRWRTVAAVFGTLVGIIVGVTLMLLRWHYLTDVIAGAAVSIASTLIVDAVTLSPGEARLVQVRLGRPSGKRVLTLEHPEATI